MPAQNEKVYESINLINMGFVCGGLEKNLRCWRPSLTETANGGSWLPKLTSPLQFSSKTLAAVDSTAGSLSRLISL